MNPFQKFVNQLISAVQKANQRGQQGAQPVNTPQQQALTQKLGQAYQAGTSTVAPLAPLGTAPLKGQTSPYLSGGTFTGDTPKDVANLVGANLPAFGANGELTPNIPSVADTTMGVDMAADNAKEAATNTINQTKTGIATTPNFGEAGFAKIPGQNLPPTTSEGLPPVQTLPTPSGPTKLANKIQGNISKVTASDPYELGATDKTAQIQETYDRLGANTPQAQDRIAKNLYDKVINPYMEANPINRPIEGENGIISNVVKEMQSLDPGLDSSAAGTAARPIVQRMYGLSTGTPGDITVNNILDSNLMKMKSKLSNTSAVRNFYNPNVANPTDLNSLSQIGTYRAISNIIGQDYPEEISQAIKDYGNLKEGAPSMGKAAASNSNGVTPNPKTYINALKPIAEGALRGDSRVLGPAALGIGALGMKAFNSGLPQKLADTFIHQNPTSAKQPGGQVINNNLGQGTVIHSVSDIPQSPDQIKPNKDGTFALGDPQAITGADNQPLAISEDYYKSQYKTLQYKLSQDTVANKFEDTPETNQAVANDNAALNNLETKHTLSQQLNQDYSTASNLNDQFNIVIKKLNDPSIKIGLDQAFGFKGYTLGQLANLTDPKYASLVGAVKALQTAPGVSINWQQGMGTDEAIKTLTDASVRMQNAFYKHLRTFGGAGATTGGVTGNTTMGEGAPISNGGGSAPAPTVSNNLTPPPPSATLNAPVQFTGQSFENP